MNAQAQTDAIFPNSILTSSSTEIPSCRANGWRSNRAMHNESSIWLHLFIKLSIWVNETPGQKMPNDKNIENSETFLRK